MFLAVLLSAFWLFVLLAVPFEMWHSKTWWPKESGKFLLIAVGATILLFVTGAI